MGDSTESLEVRLAKVESRSSSNGHRLDSLEANTDALHRLVTSLEVLTVALAKPLRWQKLLIDDTDKFSLAAIAL